MIDQTETAVRIERVTDLAPEALWAIIINPRRHAELDGSGTVRGNAAAEPISAVGQIFTMSMSATDLGDYISENHVVVLVPGERVVWETTRDGKTPPGFRWGWSFEPASDGRTLIVHSYDWSRVNDEAILARVGFPRVSGKEMNETVSRLIEVASG